MRCEECLTVLATASATEIRSTPAVVAHFDQCANCSVTMTQVIQREQRLSEAFALARPVTATHTITDAAMLSARRKKFARAYIGALLVAASVLSAFGVKALLRARHEVRAALAQSAQVTESIDVHCLTAAQAGEIIQGYLRSNGSVYYASKLPLQVLTVRGTTGEMEKIHEVLGRYDTPATSVCTVQPAASSGPR